MGSTAAMVLGPARLHLVKAGGSAQAEYERRRARDRDRRRQGWKLRLALLVATPFVAYGLVQLFAWGFNDWFVSRLIESVPDSTADPQADPPIAPETAHLFGLLSAALATLGAAVTWLGPRRSTEAWATGAAGERATGRTLEGLPDGYEVRHDVRMPGSRANIDHVVIGPSGAFTIETKNYSAGVTIKNGKARTKGRSMDKEIAQAKRQAETMRKVLGVDVRPIICVQGGGLTRGWFEKPTVEGVRFCSGRSLVKTLTSS